MDRALIPTTWSRRSFLGLALAGAAGFIVGCAPATSARWDRSAVAAQTFPRTGVCFLEQHWLPSTAELSRYDIVVIDSEWQHRQDRAFFDTLRQKNPRMILLAYVNLVDSVQQTGSQEYWANTYSLWQFESPTVSRFPRAWLAYTANGRPVHEWEDRIMTNLTDVAPRVHGLTYAEYAANWVVDHVWSTGIWDGIFLDVWGDRIYTADSDHWDIDHDGVDEPDSRIYGPGGPLDRGLTSAETIMRTRMPGALLIANGDRHASGNLDGLAFESFADTLSDADRVPEQELSKYVTASVAKGLRQPSVGMTINLRRTISPNSPAEYARARFFLCATLMQNAWWAPMGADYAEPVYYDELDGGGLGRGYLGQPLVPSPDMQRLSVPTTAGTGSPAPGVYRRDFEHGLAIVNTSDQARDIPLSSDFKHLLGTQAPEVNNGTVVRSVRLAPHDGVIMLRPG